jgi:tagatose-1,6-bisphosphate aldolase non-catalytic subunit AgaZ/GatZ
MMSPMTAPAALSLNDVVKAIGRLSASGESITLLGICPMSEELIRAPVELAVELDFPVYFVASRNQVSEERGGGYVMGLTPQGFMQKISDLESSIPDKERPYLRFVGVDHCGPWYREHEKRLETGEALEAVKRTLAACLQAGYSAIHIDCSFLPHNRPALDEEETIRLTVELMEFCEEQRKKHGLSCVAYEIGTEETAGLGITPAHFRRSIAAILQQLKQRGLPRPAFAVGRTGAKIEMLDNAGPYEYTSASTLPKVAAEFKMGFKEHNADHLTSLILSLHPPYGITGANIGPSLAATQTRAMLNLAEMEEKGIKDGRSGLYRLMSKAVLEQAPFGKWLKKGDSWTAETLRRDPARLLAVTLVTGHYTYYDPQVRRATLQLYENLRKNNIVAEPEKYVIDAIKKEILRYVDNFNLKGGTAKILAAIKQFTEAKREDIPGHGEPGRNRTSRKNRPA